MASDTVEAPPDRKAEDGALEDEEIDVTPEMIAAGAFELSRFHPEYESDRDAVIRIYRAMAEARADPFQSREGRLLLEER